MKSLIRNRTGKFPRRGFSLTELALVLSLISVVVGSLWGLLTMARQSSQIEQTAGQITIVATNVRGFYGGQVGVPNLGYGAITSALLNPTIGAIPAYMQREGGTGCTNPGSACADTIWGMNSGSPLVVDPAGTFRVCNWSGSPASVCNSSAPGSTSSFFGIMLTGLSEAICEKLVTRVSYSGVKGLYEVSINSNNLATTLGKSVEPVSETDARAYCPPGAAGTASVVFVYPIVTPP